MGKRCNWRVKLLDQFGVQINEPLTSKMFLNCSGTLTGKVVLKKRRGLRGDGIVDKDRYGDGYRDGYRDVDGDGNDCDRNHHLTSHSKR